MPAQRPHHVSNQRRSSTSFPFLGLAAAPLSSPPTSRTRRDAANALESLPLLFRARSVLFVLACWKSPGFAQLSQGGILTFVIALVASPATQGHGVPSPSRLDTRNTFTQHHLALAARRTSGHRYLAFPSGRSRRIGRPLFIRLNGSPVPISNNQRRPRPNPGMQRTRYARR